MPVRSSVSMLSCSTPVEYESAFISGPEKATVGCLGPSGQFLTDIGLLNYIYECHILIANGQLRLSIV